MLLQKDLFFFFFFFGNILSGGVGLVFGEVELFRFSVWGKLSCLGRGEIELLGGGGGGGKETE